MKALVVYESMYGNTHAIAEAIAAGLRSKTDVNVVSVHQASEALDAETDLLVVGGPTHVHGMTRPTTRQAAVDALDKQPQLTLDADAEGIGVREWLESLGSLDLAAAAYDTRVDMSAAFSGRAAKGIARGLRKLGCRMVAEPESFLVTKETELEPGEVDRAREWGASLVAQLAAVR